MKNHLLVFASIKKHLFILASIIILSGIITSCDAGSAPAIPASPPLSPEGLVLTIIDENTVDIAWADTATDETGYNVYWSDTNALPSSPNVQLPADSQTCTAGSLTPLTTYYFWVMAYNDSGESSALSGTATPGPVPAAPGNLTVTATETLITLDWTDNADDETGYNVFWSTSAAKPGAPGSSLPADTVSCEIPGLAPSTTYHFWVEAFNDYGSSTAAVILGTLKSAPPSPDNLVVSVGTYRINVTWNDNAVNETGYDVYWSIDGIKPADPAEQLAADATACSITGIYANTTYSFWVEAKNDIGTSSAATGEGTTITKTFKELFMEPNGWFHMAVHTLTDETDLNFYWSDNVSDMGISNDPVGVSGAGADLHYWTLINNFDSTKTWHFWAETVKDTDTLYIHEKIEPGPPMTGTLACTQAGDSRIDLSWEDVSGESAYNIYWDKSAVKPLRPNASVGADVTAFSATSLDPGTEYNFWVSAVSQGIGGAGFPGLSINETQSTTGSGLGPNLALGKTAVCSSVEGDNTADKAIDGNDGSRWASEFTDGGFLPAWIIIDLGESMDFSVVRFKWETAYAKSYTIETSGDGVGFTAVYSTTEGTGGTETIEVGTQNARYIKMNCTERGTPWGPSLWEFEVFNP
ncbi:MAG: fibronectin type III domain-containing protein [Spirochaetales bacterium]|nr:fibronectin type III domain-containing protein [Spirochaetales bacterium]